MDQSLMTALPSDDAGCYNKRQQINFEKENIITHIFPSFTNGFS
jgi:hypothetical protein